MESIQDIPLLIVTSEANAWSIPGFLRQLNRYFPSFKGPIFANIPSANISGITGGIPEAFRNFDWSTRTLQAVKLIKASCFLSVSKTII